MTKITVEFTRDMPVAAVDVVNPDLEIVSTAMLSPGVSRQFDVESTAAFLRIHLPDGRTVKVSDPGETLRTIDASRLGIGRHGVGLGGLGGMKDAGALGTSGIARGGAGAVVGLGFDGTMDLEQPDLALSANEELSLGGEFFASVRGTIQNVHGITLRTGVDQLWALDSRATAAPNQLVVQGSSGVEITTRLPATVRGMALDLSKRGRRGRDLNIRALSRSATADAILCYLKRGDMTSASAMRDFADEAEAMVLQDDQDPYSGIVGAYLLLRLRDFDRLKEWVKEIADRFEFMPDGCIAWAWQEILLRGRGGSDADRYLLSAVERGLPIYTEGLQLLLDGLRMMGDKGQSALNSIVSRQVDVVWSAPLLTLVDRSNTTEGDPVIVPKINVTIGGDVSRGDDDTLQQWLSSPVPATPAGVGA